LRAVLTGFMGSGKTTVGRIVARTLGVPWIDLDEAVVGRAGKRVDRIFAESGEGAFRELERSVALEIFSRTDPVIVSTGGGTLADGVVRDRARAWGRVIALHVSPEMAVERVARSGETRPLLQGDDPVGRAREVLATRSGVYGLADGAVQTDRRTPEGVAAEVCAILEGRAVAVSLGPRGYPVYVGRGLLAQVPRLVLEAGLGARGAALVCDRAVARRYGGPLVRALDRTHRHVVRVVQAPGDRHKNLRSASRIYDRVLQAGLERSSPVLALGGGVVSDLAGFVAATLFRGVPFVPIPTTLLAQADASVGGKVGVNHTRGKNLLGAFHQPRLVVADLDTLRTLPARELRAGLAEVVKCGVIRDPRILDLLDAAPSPLAAGGFEVLEEPLRRAIEVKARVVARDERESGERRVLNFGHTLGHALEAAARYEGLLHGEAVSIGMVAALRIGHERGITPAPLVERVTRLLRCLGLPVELDPVLGKKAVPFLGLDKKIEAGAIRFVLVSEAGRTEEVGLTPTDLARVLVG
jgi:shikimate kinase / 3-dehydroquinate synthase